MSFCLEEVEEKTKDKVGYIENFDSMLSANLYTLYTNPWKLYLHSTMTLNCQSVPPKYDWSECHWFRSSTQNRPISPKTCLDLVRFGNTLFYLADKGIRSNQPHTQPTRRSNQLSTLHSYLFLDPTIPMREWSTTS